MGGEGGCFRFKLSSAGGRGVGEVLSPSWFLSLLNAMFPLLRGFLPDVRQPFAFLTGWRKMGRAGAERSILSFQLAERDPHRCSHLEGSLSSFLFSKLH